MRKIWAIAWKDIYTTFTDRNLVLIMLVTPLALSTIIALAFSNLSGGGAPIRDIPVALVNLDEGSEIFNGGEVFAQALGVGTGSEDSTADSAPASSPDCPSPVADEADSPASAGVSLTDLTETRLFADADSALAALGRGEFAAVIIIPAGFSQSISYSQTQREIQPIPVEVIGDPARPISASVIRSIAESISNQLLSGQITVAATIETMIARAQTDPAFGLAFLAANADGSFQPDFACAFTPGLNPISINAQQITGEGEDRDINLLVSFGSSLAIFFALFTANGGATNILEESRNWTLQRMLTSPTSRLQIMSGKLFGIFVTVLLQILFLCIALTLINSLLTGSLSFVWGDNLLAIAALLIFSALAAAGIGMVTAAAATSPEQAGVIGTIVAIFMGVAGGAFFQLPVSIPVVDLISRFSVVRWGSEAFTSLARGGSDIGLNLLVLGGIGAVFFAISLVIFNRRQDI